MARVPDPAVGLCARCLHGRKVKSRNATYWLCERSRTDMRFPKYPRLPVIACSGFEPDEVDRDEPGSAEP